MKNGTILLVEDNEDDVFLMRRALKSAKIGNPLQVMEDGQQAIDYLSGTGAYADRNAFPYPEVVFLDLKLPHKSGFDVLTWLQGRPDLPRPTVFVLSSSNLPKDMERAAMLGAKSYLVKPPSPESLHTLGTQYQIRWAVGEN
jgi:CheY-like chemotaxis protein